MKTRLLVGLLSVALVAGAFPAPKSGLPFIHDDFPKALNEAKQRKLPIFVECWAPW